ncbi:hypothetical protein A0H81_10609 [Grifola frondosa]|uniref:Uncharacterized protein n=1 Tax=Grifola frondosa TaxID=5627 RepID=A0A1C7LXN3_GRIFR|nr:hypothetical protein A0H81_10609 [Grifola frondosa]
MYAVFSALTLISSVYVQSIATALGQPSQTDAPLGPFEIVGDSVASAQQIFLCTLDKVYVMDKAERNPTQINGHPAWAAGEFLTLSADRAVSLIAASRCDLSEYSVAGNTGVQWAL